MWRKKVRVFFPILTGIIVAFGLLIETSLLQAAESDEYSPVWSPDGEYIAYVSGEAENSDIWVMKSDGTEKQNVSNRDQFAYEPHWSPDGKYLAYVSAPPESSLQVGNVSVMTASEIWIVDMETMEQVNLTENNAEISNRYNHRLTWSPDGQYISFDSVRDLYSQSWVVNVKDQTFTHLSQGVDDNAQFIVATWSPNSEQIMFVTNVDISDVNRLWISSIHIIQPVEVELDEIPVAAYWSPFEDIVLIKSFMGSYFLYDLTENSITDLDFNGTNPEWSPTGRYILVEILNIDIDDKSTYENWDIMLFDIENQSQTVLLSDPHAVEMSATWSPDESAFAFASNQDGDYDIWVLELDTFEMTNLTDDD